LSNETDRLARLAWLLDASIPVPGTRFRVGLDALIGLVPVLGDLAGVALSGYILAEAARLGASRSVLARMAFNVALEGLVGLVPLAGDVFDAAWKANQRNVRLLARFLERPARTRRSSAALVWGFVALLLAFLVACGALGWLALRALFA
jgi:hypothetical protein